MNKFLLCFALLAIALMALAPTATAARRAKPAPAPADQVFDFEGDEVSTDFLKPNTLLIEGLRRGRMSSLISIRLDFVDEIVRSAEDI